MAERRAVLVISSHVARGSVGNRAAVFALASGLATLQNVPWPVPSRHSRQQYSPPSARPCVPFLLWNESAGPHSSTHL